MINNHQKFSIPIKFIPISSEDFSSIFLYFIVNEAFENVEINSVNKDRESLKGAFFLRMLIE